jgi:hypothetical protein
VTYSYLERQFEAGAAIKVTRLTKNFDFNRLQDHHGQKSVPLFLIDGKKNLRVVPTAEAGDAADRR